MFWFDDDNRVTHIQAYTNDFHGRRQQPTWNRKKNEQSEEKTVMLSERFKKKWFIFLKFDQKFKLLDANVTENKMTGLETTRKFI